MILRTLTNGLFAMGLAMALAAAPLAAQETGSPPGSDGLMPQSEAEYLERLAEIPAVIAIYDDMVDQGYPGTIHAFLLEAIAADTLPSFEEFMATERDLP